MTESVATPRSNSSRPSSKSRRRAAAAADRAPAHAVAQPGGDVKAADAQRDERTLDLFGEPVIEIRERVPGTVRDVAAAEAVTVADARVDGQATLDGFDAAGEAGAISVAVEVGTAEVLSGTEGDGVDAFGHMTEKAAGGSEANGGAVDAAARKTLAGAAAIEAAQTEAARIELAQTNAARTELAQPKFTQTELAQAELAQAEAAPRQIEPIAAMATDVAAVGAAATEAASGEDQPSAAKAVSQSIDPTGTRAESRSAEPGLAGAGDPEQPAAPATSSASQPVASAAAFVTKPSSDRAEPPAAAPGASPSLDPDALVRPLSDRIAALQTETAALTRAADREMRRVNRLLLALAVVVLAGLVALVLQTIQIAGLKRDAIAQQQRTDRLVADLSTQQATLMTLEQHNEALLAQVDRLARSVNRQTASVKHVRRGR
ncbi:flagellar hook-length control protein FliK [Burkholderia sp. PU8-34]